MPPSPRFMARAIELSRKGFPAPNPHVGCVIVRNGEIIGEGWHECAGGAHAEVAAIASAGGDVKGADVYVTLEPCNHQGRTGPCSLALIEAGVRRVFYACPDPNPKAVGGGETLRQAGVEVEDGLMAKEAAAANHQFLFAMSHKRPLVVVKAACSLDGRIALPNGESQWITGPEAREAAHRLRADLGAVLVGRRTVELDDPHLTARIPGVHNQPIRVVLDPQRKLKGTERVFDDQAKTLHITGHIDLPTLLENLFQQGITGLLVEGGAVTIGHFLEARLCDRVDLFVAPKILGSGPSWCEAPGATSIPESWLEITTQERLGDDLHLTLTQKST